jgi:glycerophosphoryl diester phosphodiesterase
MVAEMTKIRTVLAFLIAAILLATIPPALPNGELHDVSESLRLNCIKPQTPQDLRELFRYTGESMHLVSAHRGGSKAGFPENCIATFENTLEQTFAIIEIDPRYAKDGTIVVHHDATLDRTTTGRGLLCDATLAELRELRLKDPVGHVTDFRIPTLGEVLEWARGKTVLVIDQKDVPVEERVRKIEEHQAEAFTILIAYSFKDVRKCYGLNKDIMMEVMIPNRAKLREFDETRIPWGNIIAFTGHTQPEDAELFDMIHTKGACCIVGTSRNLDRQLTTETAKGNKDFGWRYRQLLECGVDVIETDLPRRVGGLLYGESNIPPSKASFFRRRQL